MQIWKLKFGHKAKYLFRQTETSFGQDFEVKGQARFESSTLVSILLLMIGRCYEVESWLRF